MTVFLVQSNAYAVHRMHANYCVSAFFNAIIIPLYIDVWGNSAGGEPPVVNVLDK